MGEVTTVVLQREVPGQLQATAATLSARGVSEGNTAARRVFNWCRQFTVAPGHDGLEQVCAIVLATTVVRSTQRYVQVVTASLPSDLRE